jgi:hypothetical protein
MKIDKTYQELIQLKFTAEFIQKMQNESEDIQPKVVLARVIKKACKSLEDYEDLIEDIRLKHCLKDPTTKKILKDSEGNFEFSEEGYKLVKAEIKELQKTVVEVHYDNVWPYADLLATFPEKSRPFNQWEDVKEVLQPFYSNE